jgi:hypothetical protein
MRILAAAGSIIVVAAIALTFVLIKLNAKTTPSPGSLSNGHAGAPGRYRSWISATRT